MKLGNQRFSYAYEIKSVKMFESKGSFFMNCEWLAYKYVFILAEWLGRLNVIVIVIVMASVDTKWFVFNKNSNNFYNIVTKIVAKCWGMESLWVCRLFVDWSSNPIFWRNDFILILLKNKNYSTLAKFQQKSLEIKGFIVLQNKINTVQTLDSKNSLF